MLLCKCDEVHSGEKQGYIPVHSGTFEAFWGTCGAVHPSGLHIAFVQQKLRRLSEDGGSVELQGHAPGGSFGATTYPFYNIKGGKRVRESASAGDGQGRRKPRATLEIYQLLLLENLPPAHYFLYTFTRSA